MSKKNVEWEWKKLKDICEKGSSSIKQGDLKKITGDYPIYGASGFIQNVDFYQQDKEYIGIVKDGSGVGRTMFLPAYSSVIGTLQYILPKEGNSIKFVNYALQNIDFSKLIQGAAIPHIYFKDYGEMDIAVPPLDEQERIVKVLDDAFEKIDTIKNTAETNLQNAKDLFDAELRKTFDDNDWQIKKLEDVCIITSSKRIFKNEYVKKGIPFYRTKEIKELSHGEPISLELYISNDRYESIKEQFGVPKIGDVLISAVGTIGEILVIDNDNPFYFKDGNIIWMKDIKGIQSDFLKFLLTSVVEKLKAMTRGAAYNALTIEKFKKQEIPLPPLPVQKQIVAKLDSLSEKVKQLESNYKQVLADCDELKKALLKQAFEGML